LDAFHSRVMLELYRRQEILARKQERPAGMGGVTPANVVSVEMNQLKKQWEREGKYQWACKDPERVLELVRDLVDFQAEVMHHDQSLIYAEDYIRDRPEIVVNRIVSHIQYLFEVKALDGVLPRLNQVYLFVEEMRNFLTTVRSILHAKPGFANEAVVSNAALLIEVQRMLTVSAGSMNKLN
jgi:hypothetical protein